MEKLLCQKCGSENHAEAIYCAKCGTKLKQKKQQVKSSDDFQSLIFTPSTYESLFMFLGDVEDMKVEAIPTDVLNRGLNAVELANHEINEFIKKFMASTGEKPILYDEEFLIYSSAAMLVAGSLISAYSDKTFALKCRDVLLKLKNVMEYASPEVKGGLQENVDYALGVVERRLALENKIASEGSLSKRFFVIWLICAFVINYNIPITFVPRYFYGGMFDDYLFTLFTEALEPVIGGLIAAFVVSWLLGKFLKRK